MTGLEIRGPDGTTETRPLSRRQPVSIGRHPISDIRVDDDAVAPLACRVSWNGHSFEVATATPEGVEVNGTLVRRKDLRSGDVIRVGGTDLVVSGGDVIDDGPAAIVLTAGQADEVRTLGREPGQVEFDVLPAAAPPAWASKAAAGTASEPADAPVLLDEPPKPRPAARQADAGTGRLGRAKRPGEQDVLTSPLVLGFGGLALALLLAGGVIWLLIGREGADRLYETAVADREAGRYTQAVRGFETFLAEYPTDRRANEARYALGKARVERFTAGAAPDWPKAVEAFERFVRENRDTADFASQRDDLRALARTIALGASAATERTGRRDLLAVAGQGRTLYERQSAGDTAAEIEKVRGELNAAFTAAEAAVRKQEYFDAAATKAEAAVAANDLATAFAARDDLLTRYPVLRTNARVESLLAKTLDAERRLVRRLDDVERAAPVPSPEGAGLSVGSPLTVVGETRARAGAVSDGRLVFVVARHVLVAIEAVTGRPRWRRTIGLDTPFVPVEVSASVPAMLAVDAGRSELLLFDREDGRPLWRTPLPAPAAGPPLVRQGQIDLATADGALRRFDLETGRPLTAVAFPQPLAGPPLHLADSDRLVLFGDRSTAFTLDPRSLDVVAVSYVGHRPGSIDAPAVAAGRLVLLVENDRLDAALLRVFEFDRETGTLRPAAAERVTGRVTTPPSLRGNVLFVASTPERVTAYSVSDDPGRPPLTRLAETRVPGGRDLPTFLTAGPDGQVWAAGSALRRLQLTAEGLKIDTTSLAPGHHTQPPQESGDSLFVARSLSSTPAVFVSQADREEMTGNWRTVLGGAVVAVASSGDAVGLVTDAGQVATFESGDLAKGGFANGASLPGFDEASPEPLRAAELSDGRVVAWRNGPEPRLWIVAATAKPEAPRRPPADLQAAPALTDAGLVLPLAGRLEVLPLGGSGAAVEPFLLPIESDARETPPAWRSVVRLDGTRVAALDDRGLVRLIAVRREPTTHLAEVAAASAGDDFARPLAVAGDRIVAAAGGRVTLLDPAGLNVAAERELDGPITGGPWHVEGTAFVENGPGRVVALDAATLDERWRCDLGSAAAGPPVRTDGGWFAASQAGRVVRLGDDGSERGRHELAGPLTGLVRIGETVAAVSLDGSLHPLRVEATPAVAAESRRSAEASP